MAFNLVYTRNGKVVCRTFMSYYEFITKKNQLRSEGIEYKEQITGKDVLSKIESPSISTNRDRIKLNNFLEMLDGIGNYKSAKARKKGTNGRTSRKSNQVGERTRNK